MHRTILHLDVDNFYVTVERADDPSLEGVPVAVVQNNSGGIVALSNEAKAGGIRKGDGVGAQGRANIGFLVEMKSMSLDECRRRCPQLVIKPMRVDRYREVGIALLRLLRRWTDLVEKTSYDDFYMDVTSRVENATASDEELPPRTFVASCNGHSVPYSELPVSLRQGCKIAAEMRVAIRSELSLVASVGVGRTKLSARMLSPLAKPDGIIVLPDLLALPFFSKCRLLEVPSFQSQRGRAIAEQFLSLKEHGSRREEDTNRQQGHLDNDTFLNRLKSVTLGDLTHIGRARLTSLIGEKDARKIFSLGDGGKDGGAAVAPRGPPKALACEASFPPTDDSVSLQIKLLELATTLWQRLLVDSVEHVFRSPQKLVITWRRGYAQKSSVQPGLSTSSPTKGVQHSRSIQWPVAPCDKQRADVVAFRSAPSGHSRVPQASSDCEYVKQIAVAALRVLLDTVAAPRQITRLILAADFGSAQHGQAASSTLDKFVRSRPDTGVRHSGNSSVSGEVASPRTSAHAPCHEYGLDVDGIDPATLAELPHSIRAEIESRILGDRHSRLTHTVQRKPGEKAGARQKRTLRDLKDMFASKRGAICASEIIVVDD